MTRLLIEPFKEGYVLNVFKLLNSQGCVIINEHNELAAELEFMLQPIVRNDPKEIVAFEALSRITTHIEKENDTEFFFSKRSLETIKQIILVQIDSFDYFSERVNKLISYNAPISVFLDDQFVLDLSVTTNRPIAIEITEFDLTDDESIERVKRNMTMLRVMNDFEFWLDDYLHTDVMQCLAAESLCWNIIKIDKKYLNEGSDSGLMLNVIDSFKRQMSDVIIEGVESVTQFNRIKNTGALMQGYLFSMPLTLNEAMTFISSI